LNALVTGAAGFIGSTLTDRLLKEGHTVRGIDNFSTGRRDFLDGALASGSFELCEIDLLDAAKIEPLFNGIDVAFHLAANADVRFGPEHPGKDLEQNTVCTANVLEAMRKAGVRRIAFSSTGSVYGEPEIFPTPEDAPFPVQTSLYGASKLAAEGLIAAYCEAFGIQGYCFRFVSILGKRYTHGHVFDFFGQLLQHPDRLRVLGDGTQRKSYLEVQDCIDAILLAMEKADASFQIFNLGTDEYCAVKDSVAWICERMGVTPAIEYTGGARGWIGDSPFIFLDCSRIRNLGWKPRSTIREGVVETVRYLETNRQFFSHAAGL
jgi:UDP-glucose 4-epimerase